MKLRNKKTGQLGNFIINKDHFECVDLDYVPEYRSVAELSSEWVDAPEEPKGIQCIYYVNHFDAARLDGVIVGFSSKEEAKKAVKKLKAWKRLKDKGFRFIEWELDMKTIADGKIWFDIGLNTQWDAEQLLEREPEVKKSLDLLFGGEE